MEVNGIIEKDDQPTPCVSSMVVVGKNGCVSICLDPKELNEAVMREHHHISTLEVISFRFSGMSVFTIVEWLLKCPYRSSVTIFDYAQYSIRPVLLQTFAIWYQL